MSMTYCMHGCTQLSLHGRSISWGLQNQIYSISECKQNFKLSLVWWWLLAVIQLMFCLLKMIPWINIKWLVVIEMAWFPYLTIWWAFKCLANVNCNCYGNWTLKGWCGSVIAATDCILLHIINIQHEKKWFANPEWQTNTKLLINGHNVFIVP